MNNLFDSLSTTQLIVAIQTNAIILDDNKKQKRLSNDQLGKIRSDLFFMRQEVIPRLRAMNRLDPEFFPVGSYVVQSFPQPPQDIDDWGPSNHIPDRHGVVKGYMDGKIVVEPEGQKHWVLVEAQVLKIKYIR